LIEAFRARDAKRAAEVMRGHAAMPIEMTMPEERGTA
jgi:DNA-binding GntR family transcriptional regulator